ncbi:glycoside hydrolase superfamily [Pseudomassariella vexata]|uniref:Alpha-galactosidase n=1 Tax=Pseudomassariella vexata TaxID=1141098 RepID=A0A1Y2DE39_9PEZI|nr:glycoside hydrolase superfamily [Pseudomassariella vexata]ORY57530.1 glycoside hydrolase superfamily [Pseudomassariella vexata]
MGWNSYNYYGCRPSEDIMVSNAQGLVDLGLADLGYTSVTTDCGWPSRDRDSEGRIQWNETLFPSGGPALGQFIHGLGLEFGLYSGAGYLQCGSTDLPASLGYEEIDAETFAEWGGDSLKYDNCYPVSNTTMVDYVSKESISPARFEKMAGVLDTIDRDMHYFVCQWGVGYDVGEWASAIGTTWRISNDIFNAWRSIWRIANEVVPYYRHTTVGAFPDMDMLIVGLKALSVEEERFHFGMWAINKSPLIIGARMDAQHTPQESLDILANEVVIAINQDPLGKQAELVRRYTEEEWDIWAGELSGSRKVLGIANWRNDSQTVEVDLSAVGVASAKARDVWAATDLGSIEEIHTVELSGHELKLLVLSDIKASRPLESKGYYSAANASIAGSAEITDCDSGDCLPVGQKIGNIGSGSTVTFSSVNASSAGSKVLGVDFINYDIALDTAWDNGFNIRNMTIAVNGGVSKRWAFPISGGDWFETGRLTIESDGFEKGAENEVVFGNVGDAWAPDLVGFELF